MSDERVRWGILGPGGIAREFLIGARGSATGLVTAVGTRDPDRPELAGQFPGLRVHGSYDALLADPEIDAIYIATPHPFHAEWAIRAASQGKHVLCEKPAGMNAGEVEAMFAAAAENGIFLAEAYMYRLHPLTAFILDLLRQGKIGEVRMIKSSFGFAIPGSPPGHRLFAKALGGGAILDVGGYPMSMARLIAGLASPDGIAEPAALQALVRHGPTGVDEIASALVAFPNGIVADLSCSISLWQDNVLHVIGTEGRLEVDAFWFGSGKQGGTAGIRFTPPNGATGIIPFDTAGSVYSFQFEAASRAIRAGETGLAWPAMTREDSIGNAVALDRWIAATRVEPPIAFPPD
jgi:predicted dehydrogenase